MYKSELNVHIKSNLNRNYSDFITNHDSIESQYIKLYKNTEYISLCLNSAEYLTFLKAAERIEESFRLFFLFPQLRCLKAV